MGALNRLVHLTPLFLQARALLPPQLLAGTRLAATPVTGVELQFGALQRSSGNSTLGRRATILIERHAHMRTSHGLLLGLD
jgi:hypothetical protein